MKEKIISINKQQLPSYTCISCVYLFLIGSVKHVRARTKINIPALHKDDALVGKFGLSRNLLRRSNEHKKTYGADIKLLLSSEVEPKNLFAAEKVLKQYFDRCNFRFDPKGNREIIIFQFEDIPAIKDCFESQAVMNARKKN